MADWNSKQYLKFKNERTQPAMDLVNRLNLDQPQKIIDIGCGPGNSTRVLKDRYPEAYILGVDNSEDMIASARKSHSDLDFEMCDVSKDLNLLDKKFDIVFSNACIQWIPDHPRLIKELLGLLNPQGILAVQIPNNFKEPIHRIIQEVSTSSKWKGCFDVGRVFYTLTQSEYFDTLSEVSQEFALWETIYYHVMDSHQAILEWYRATGLKPYLDVLNDEMKQAFEKDVMERIIKQYPAQKNGKIIFRFPRLFFTANPKA